MNDDQGRRIDGWKSIAGYFGRDRSTVSRWARERGLPVHQIPGGKTKTVYAFERELQAWSRQHAAEEPLDALALPNADAAAESSSPARPRWLLAAMLAVLIVAIGLGLFAATHAPERRTALPDDPKVAADYVAARDAWGRRTAVDLEQAFDLYRSVIERDPDFAPARSGLAETWLIFREYGSVADATAFEAARNAARSALKLDPDLPAAHRAMGFIQYWWDNDPDRALPSFKRALELDPKDGQTQFWYANVLADLGKYDDAERYYASARLALPGLSTIAVEHACAQWQAGRTDRALELLSQLRTQFPVDPTIRNCLMWTYMTKGDIRAYSREFTTYAQLRREPALQTLAGRLAVAVAQDAKTAHLVLIADAERELAAGTRRIRTIPAFYASSMHDRPTLLRLLKAARLGGEQWYWPSVTRNIERNWTSDRKVLELLHSVVMPPPDA